MLPVFVSSNRRLATLMQGHIRYDSPKRQRAFLFAGHSSKFYLGPKVMLSKRFSLFCRRFHP